MKRRNAGLLMANVLDFRVITPSDDEVIRLVEGHLQYKAHDVVRAGTDEPFFEVVEVVREELERDPEDIDEEEHS